MTSSQEQVKAWLDICSGSIEENDRLRIEYESTDLHFQKVKSHYGLEGFDRLEGLGEEEREVLIGCDPTRTYCFKEPRPLRAGRLTIRLSDSNGLRRTRENFLSLLRGDKGPSKSDRNKRLHYKGVKVHRVETNFVVQTGDVTRNDGSGGEATVSGGVFKAEVEGLNTTPRYGSVCMTNGGRKDSITSQFFIVTTQDPDQLKKLSNKQYVTFGRVLLELEEKGQEEEVEQNRRVFARWDLISTQDGRPLEECWIEDCGVF